MTSPYDSTEYKRNRAQILIGQPDCALCGRPGADTADHITPLMHGGTHALDNLRPAHARCNSAKGSRDQAKAQAQRKRQREQAVNANAFFPETQTTPHKKPMDIKRC